MTLDEPESDLRRLAARRVAARSGFYAHLTVYILVNLLLAVVNLLTSPHRLWVVWPMAGWGVGLAAHAFSVIAYLNGDQERAIQLEMERLRQRRAR